MADQLPTAEFVPVIEAVAVPDKCMKIWNLCAEFAVRPVAVKEGVPSTGSPNLIYVADWIGLPSATHEEPFHLNHCANIDRFASAVNV